MHLKRLAMPRTWPLLKKAKKFVVVPEGKKQETSIALAVLLRDLLKEVNTFSEAKKAIRNGDIEVNGRIIRNEKFPVNCFDRIFIKKINRYYTLHFNEAGKLQVKEIDGQNYLYKPCKIVGKKILKGNKVQLNFLDGGNLLVNKNDASLKVGDGVLLHAKDKKIKKVLPLAKNAEVVIVKGKNIGKIGKVLEIKNGKVEIDLKKKKKELPIENVFVVEENEFK